MDLFSSKKETKHPVIIIEQIQSLPYHSPDEGEEGARPVNELHVFGAGRVRVGMR
jgi:hypothetical protein